MAQNAKVLKHMLKHMLLLLLLLLLLLKREDLSLGWLMLLFLILCHSTQLCPQIFCTDEI